MALSAKKQERYTFADILGRDEGERYEIIDGKAFLMSSPVRAHQEISGEIFRQLANYLDGKNCRVYHPPFAVRLFEREGDAPEDVDTVVEPDITVVCDKSKLDKYGCKGAPDMVIEILSPSSRRYDRIIKLDLYQQAGVREYWVVSPEEETVLVFLLEDGKLLPHESCERGDMAKVTVLDDCFIELEKVFAGTE